MLKHLLILLLTCALLPVILSAQAAPDDLTLIAADPDDANYYSKAVTTLAAHGDTLYIVANGQILTWKNGDAAPAVWLDNVLTSRNYYQSDDRSHVVSALYMTDTGIIAFDTQNGQLFPLSANTDGTALYGESVVLEMDARVEEDNETYLNFQFEDQVLAGDTLLVSGYDFESGGDLSVYAWNAATGEQKAVSLEYAVAMCAYKDGKILCVTGDPDNMYDSEAGTYRPWTLAVYDPASDETTEITQVDTLRYYDVRAMVYDEAADTLYLGSSNKLYRMVHLQNCELAAYHPAADLWSEGHQMAVIGTQVALFDEHGLYLRTPNPALLPDATLSVYGYYASEEHMKAIAQLGDMPVFFANDVYYDSAQALGQALSSGENQLDLLYLQLNWIDFARLMEKGYCQDLSNSEIISGYIAELYPFLQESVTLNGKIWAVPLDMYVSGWHYNAEAFEELGLEAPDTYVELFEQITAWADESNAENQEEYAYADFEDSYRDTLFYELFDDYEQYMLSRGEELTLDNDVFRTVMQSLESMDAENVEVTVDWSMAGDEVPEEIEALWNKTMLTSYYYTISPNGNYDMKPLHLRLTEDCSYVLPASVSVIFVNPRSENPDAAIAYLEALVTAYRSNSSHMVAMSPSYNEPVPNPYYEENVASMQKELARMEEALAKADPIDKPELQKNLDDYLEYTEEYIETGRYRITAESIALYRAEMEYAVLELPSVMNSGSGDNSFYTLRQRYLDGQIGLEQFIQEGGSKLRLMQLESK